MKRLLMTGLLIFGAISSGKAAMAKKIDKEALANKIKALVGLDAEERSELLGLLSERKKYGLVWEEKPEDVEEAMREQLPVLAEVKERAIVCGNSNAEAQSRRETQSAPNHILIEGDNLHALTCLTYTHSNKVDVIYIDPPYNTGNKDFVYNDRFVDKEDAFRHSKWLSFMEKRLRIAKGLLSDKGVIFISIDDNEQAQLKLLCDEIFGEENFIVTAPTIMNLKGNQDQFGFAGTHEYTLVYAKSISKTVINMFPVDEDGLDEWQQDDKGYFKKGANLKSTGVNAPSNKRPFLFYPILVNNLTRQILTVTKDEYDLIYDEEKEEFNEGHLRALQHKYEQLNYSFILPVTEGSWMSWRWGRDRVEKNADEIIVTGNLGSFSLYKKQRPELGDLPSAKPKSILYKPEYSSGNGTAQIKGIFGEKLFGNPKPLDLIKDFVLLGTKKGSVILDFFAGSGTTLHAVMKLNAEDGGKRTCILVTNNENGICEKVTYERNRRVIQGYTNAKGEAVPGLQDNSLRYYKPEFVPRRPSPRNARALMAASVDLLCVKNDLYDEVPRFFGKKLKKSAGRYFDDGRGRRMLVLFGETTVPSVVETIRGASFKGKVKIYVFAHGDYAYNEEFEEVADKVELCALPAAIRNAYRRVIGKYRPQEEDAK